MRKVEVWVSTSKLGSKCSTTIEVEDDCSDAEIEVLAQETMFGLIEWSWKVTHADA